MSFEEALKILTLPENFTEEQLKSSYRELSKKNHPDKYQEGSKEYEQMVKKQSQINAAKDVLKAHLKNKEENIDVESYMIQKKQELKKIVSFNFDEYNEIFSVTLKNIIYLINNDYTEFAVLSLAASTKKAIDGLYNHIIDKIKIKFNKIKEQYYKENSIDENDVKETLNYNCTLKEFYEQLTKHKEKYSQKVLIEIRLDLEIEKYENYAGYERLSLLIDVCKNNAMFEIEQNNYQNIESSIANMHYQILTEVFAAYYTLKKKIDDLPEIIEKITDEKIKNEYGRIKREFDRGTSFSETEESVKKLESQITKWKEEHEKQLKYQELEHPINQIYQALIERYTESSKKYNVVTEHEKIKVQNEFLKKVLNIFIQGCLGFKTIEFFKQFNNISFTNYDYDNEILESIYKSLNAKITNVYLKTTDQYILDLSSFFYLDEKNMIMYKCCYSSVSERKISKGQLESEYISLEQFLDKATFVGECINNFGRQGKTLYEDDRIVLYCTDDFFYVNRIDFYKKSMSSVAHSSKETASLEQFKDKIYVCEMIEKQVKTAVEEYNNKKSSTSSDVDSRFYYDQFGNNRSR